MLTIDKREREGASDINLLQAKPLKPENHFIITQKHCSSCSLTVPVSQQPSQLSLPAYLGLSSTAQYKASSRFFRELKQQATSVNEAGLPRPIIKHCLVTITVTITLTCVSSRRLSPSSDHKVTKVRQKSIGQTTKLLLRRQQNPAAQATKPRKTPRGTATMRAGVAQAHKHSRAKLSPATGSLREWTEDTSAGTIARPQVLRSQQQQQRRRRCSATWRRPWFCLGSLCRQARRQAAPQRACMHA